MYENDIWSMKLGVDETWDSSSVLKPVSVLAVTDVQTYLTRSKVCRDNYFKSREMETNI